MGMTWYGQVNSMSQGEQWYWKINETYFAVLNCEGNCDDNGNNLTLFMIGNNTFWPVSWIWFPDNTWFYSNNNTNSLYAFFTDEFHDQDNIYYYSIVDFWSWTQRYALSPGKSFPPVWLGNGSLITWSEYTVSMCNNSEMGPGKVMNYEHPALYSDYGGQWVYSIQTESDCNLLVINVNTSQVWNQTLQDCSCDENYQKVLGDVTPYNTSNGEAWGLTFQCDDTIQLIYNSSNH